MVDSKTDIEPPIDLLRLLARTNASPPRHEASEIATDLSSQVASDSINVSVKSKNFVRGAVIAAVGTCVVLSAAFLAAVYAPKIIPGIVSPTAQDASLERATPPRPGATSDTAVNQPSPQISAEIESVQKAMADCDRQAAQDPKTLNLLIIPVSPNTDAALKTTPEGETYQTFFLMTSKATLAGLQDASYRLNGWPFAFSINNQSAGRRKDLNLTSGLTRLSYAAEGFGKFRVGFDVSGRGYGLVWSNEYSYQPGTCYWINVRFRSDHIRDQVGGWLPQNLVR